MRVWGFVATVVILLTLSVVGSASAVRLPGVNKQTAKFRVVVEGSGEAIRQVSGDGGNGVCRVDANTGTSERYEYLRGKGVTVLITGFKGIPNSPLLMRRLGQRSFRPTFNVLGWYEDKAGGFAKREGPMASCNPVDETIGDESECGRKIHRGIDMALNLADGKLLLEAADTELTRLPGAGCGSNGVETLSGWPCSAGAGSPR